MVEDLHTIVDVLTARSTSRDPAYIFLADGTAASEVRWTYADTASNAANFARGFRLGASAPDHVSCWR